MSTTGGTEQGTVYVLDPPDVIRRKFKTAVTDSGREVAHAPDKPGISNLIEIMTVATGESIEAVSRVTTVRATARSRRRSRSRSSRCSSRSRTRYREHSRRPGRARPPPRARRRQGARGLGARRSRRCTRGWDSCASRRRRRRFGIRVALEHAPRRTWCQEDSPASARRPPSASARATARLEVEPRRSGFGAGAGPGGRRPRACASPGACGLRGSSARRGPRPRRRAPAGDVRPSSSSTPSRSAASASSPGDPSTSASYTFSTP